MRSSISRIVPLPIKKIIKYRLDYFLAKPIPVFHHIPKCAGTSLKELLNSWFEIFEERKDGHFDKAYLDEIPKVELSGLRKYQCLVSHWDVTGFYLGDRYPDIIKKDNDYFLFTFLREPLDLKLSLYYYELKKKRQPYTTPEERLFADNNYIANRFPCNESNFKQVMDRYDFIGFVETYEASVAKLARELGKPLKKVPHINKSYRDNKSNLSQYTIDRFRDENQLDYALYEYCLNKFS